MMTKFCQFKRIRFNINTFLKEEVSEGYEYEETESEEAVARVVGVKDSVVDISTCRVICSPVLGRESRLIRVQS